MGSGCRRRLRGCLIRVGEYYGGSGCVDGVWLTDDSMISYPNYKFIFPAKALGMYAARFGDEEIL
jgi:hypothetical protein